MDKYRFKDELYAIKRDILKWMEISKLVAHQCSLSYVELDWVPKNNKIKCENQWLKEWIFHTEGYAFIFAQYLNQC